MFVYGFPNFGFAFDILFTLAFIQWFNEEIVKSFQVLFTATAMAGLAFLTIKGILNLTDVKALLPVADLPESLSIPESGVFVFLFLFLGVKMGILAVLDSSKSRSNPSVEKRISVFAVGMTVALTAGIFVAWEVVLIHHGGFDKLAGSSINHMVGERMIWGQTGRTIMGIVIIAGICSAINAVYFAIRKQIQAMEAAGWLPSESQMPAGKITVTVMVLITAVLMGLGLAGHRELETLISVSMLTWLFWYGVILMSRLKYKTHKLIKLMLVILSVFILSAGTLLWPMDENYYLMIMFTLIVFILFLGFSAFLKSRQQFRLKENKAA